MGIDTNAAQLLFGAKASGADFTDSLMIGRHFFYPEVKDLQRMFQLHDVDSAAAEFLSASKGWGEHFFRLLGAHTIGSVDASSFEGATIIHDLNLPIDDSLRERFSVIYDGGTLEHVFNFPQALHNCMEMLRPGGTFIQCAPANNFMGHGFYQFSPELVYQVFSEANGFEIVTVLLQEQVRGGRTYVVANPATVGKRVQVTNRLPTCLSAIARKVTRAKIFSTPPQQSDYSAGWQASTSATVYRRREGLRSSFARAMKTHFPAGLERLVRVIYTPGFEAQPDCFRRLDVDRLVRGEFS